MSWNDRDNGQTLEPKTVLGLCITLEQMRHGANAAIVGRKCVQF